MAISKDGCSTDSLSPGMSRTDLKGYEGFYQVDEEGRVWSVERWVERVVKGTVVKQFVPGKERKLSEHGTGYYTVRLAKNGVVKTHRAHRLIAETFIPNPLNKPFVNHKNGNKRDNRKVNLEWSTEKENIEHAILHGLKPENDRDPLTGRYVLTKK